MTAQIPASLVTKWDHSTLTYRFATLKPIHTHVFPLPPFFRSSRQITFVVKNPAEHFHVPLLLNPFGYSTYRGS